MVDLVKLRKKAKENKAAAEQAVERPQALEAAKSDPAPQTKRAQAKRVEKSAPAASAADPNALADERVATPEPPPAPKAKTKPSPRKTEDRTASKLERFKETAGRLAAQQQAETRAFDEAAAEVEQLELLTFYLSGEHYAVAIEKIVEIVTPRPVTKVPNADDWILGIISLRGTIVTILDLRRKLGHPQQMGLGPDARIIVVENSGETTGFLVDKVARVARIDPSVLESHPVVATAEQSEYIRGVFQSPQGLAIVLDLERLIRI